MRNSIVGLTVLFTLFLTSCHKDENNLPLTGASSGDQVRFSLAGMVLDENGQPVANARIVLENHIQYTDLSGMFVFQHILASKKRVYITAGKNGYWTAMKAFVANKERVNYCSMTLAVKTFPYSFSGALGGSVPADGASINFPANAVVNADGTPYTGNVLVASKFLSTGDPMMNALMPGNDLFAEDQNGEEKILITYGMLGVELKGSSGEALQLASGKTAGISMPIHASQLAAAPASIPLWHFDEEEGLWKEDGEALKTGTSYEGEVSHFSWWNCDVPGDLGTVNGRVVDKNGKGIPNICVYANNRSGVYTDQDGYYIGRVPAQLPLDIYAEVFSWFSTPIHVTALSVGEVRTLPDMVVNMAPVKMVKGRFINCDSLAVPARMVMTEASGSRYYFFSADGRYEFLFPCGSATVKATSGLILVSQSYTVSCTQDSTDLGDFLLCNGSNVSASLITMQLSPNPTGFTQLSDSAFTYLSINPGFLQVNDVYNSTYDPAMSLYLSGMNFNQTGSYLLSNNPMSFAAISLKVNSKFYTIIGVPSSGFSISIFTDGQAGSPMEVNMMGPVTITDQEFGNVINCNLNSFQATFTRL
ncbi:MAG: hypothetical protein JNL88_00120 [Bacteroidia bacterium]|nr:hypothetical protein [Bacteroidia bacterium]